MRVTLPKHTIGRGGACIGADHHPPVLQNRLHLDITHHEQHHPGIAFLGQEDVQRGL